MLMLNFRKKLQDIENNKYPAVYRRVPLMFLKCR